MAMMTEKDGKIHDSKYWDGVGTLVAHTFQKLASDTEFTPIGSATTDFPYGVLAVVTAKTDIPLPLVVFGPCRVKAGGTVTRGLPLKTTADGSVEVATTTYGTEQVVGWAMESGVSGDFVLMFVTKIGG